MKLSTVKIIPWCLQAVSGCPESRTDQQLRTCGSERQDQEQFPSVADPRNDDFSSSVHLIDINRLIIN